MVYVVIAWYMSSLYCICRRCIVYAVIVLYMPSLYCDIHTVIVLYMPFFCVVYAMIVFVYCCGA